MVCWGDGVKGSVGGVVWACVCAVEHNIGIEWGRVVFGVIV